MPDDTAICECGHIYDEHEAGGKDCTVEGCHCIYFEANPDAEED